MFQGGTTPIIDGSGIQVMQQIGFRLLERHCILTAHDAEGTLLSLTHMLNGTPDQPLGPSALGSTPRSSYAAMHSQHTI